MVPPPFHLPAPPGCWPVTSRFLELLLVAILNKLKRRHNQDNLEPIILLWYYHMQWAWACLREIKNVKFYRFGIRIILVCPRLTVSGTPQSSLLDTPLLIICEEKKEIAHSLTIYFLLFMNLSLTR